MDLGGHGTAFKFAALFVGTEQTEVHGTEIFCRVNVNQALGRSLSPNTLRTGIHYRCANGCVTEQPEREPMACRNASLWREHVLVVGNINDCKMRSFHGSPYARMGFGAKGTNPVPLSFNPPNPSIPKALQSRKNYYSAVLPLLSWHSLSCAIRVHLLRCCYLSHFGHSPLSM